MERDRESEREGRRQRKRKMELMEERNRVGERENEDRMCVGVIFSRCAKFSPGKRRGRVERSTAEIINGNFNWNLAQVLRGVNQSVRRRVQQQSSGNSRRRAVR